MDTLKTVFRLPAFYPAALALAHALIAWLLPTVPAAVITAGDGVVMVVAGVLTYQQFQADRATRSVQAQATEAEAQR